MGLLSTTKISEYNQILDLNSTIEILYITTMTNIQVSFKYIQYRLVVLYNSPPERELIISEIVLIVTKIWLILDLNHPPLVLQSLGWSANILRIM